MEIQLESTQPPVTTQKPVQPETPEWTKFAGNETGDLPAGIEADTPIAIRLREGKELFAFAGDSFDLPLGDWDHDDHEKDIVAYRLLSPKDAREFIGAQAVIKYVSRHLEEDIDHWARLTHALKARFDNPLLEYMLPKLVAALRSPEGCGHKAVAANVTQSEAWVLQQAMPAFSEPSK
ncbi:hypothetical protein [uncultured Microbulbifer sp.]|uniref:hypothetical protein n=1 Tax=uncultured Microbulbifer sp. TaxID=348147 RepID=UPI002633EA94|nr:hypothetical protein [uncultured Microbulbifer sp.]